MIGIVKARRLKLPPMSPREVAIARAILAASRAVSAATPVGKLREALESSDPSSAIGVVAWEAAGEALLAALPKQYWRSHAEAKRSATLKLGRMLRKQFGVGYEFGRVDPNSLLYAQTRSATLIREWGTTSQAALRVLITRAFETGELTPRQLAALIRESGIGLTDRWATAVLRRRSTLIAGGTKPGRADELVERYSAQLLRARAENIARTEIVASQIAGTQASWQEAVDAGLIDPMTARQVWDYTPLEEECDICEPLDGVEVPLGQPFPGGLFGPPAHPRCRCQVLLKP